MLRKERMVKIRKFLKKIKWKHLIYLALCAAAVIFTGNCTYYYHVYSGRFFAPLGMALENTLMTLLGGPILSFEQILITDYQTPLAFAEKAVLVLFAVASVIIFAIHLGILVKITDAILHVFTRFSDRELQVLVIGGKKHCSSLLAKIPDTMKIYFWSQELLSEEERRDFLKRGISVEYRPYSPKEQTASEKISEEDQEAFAFLEEKKIDHVVLADDVDARNIQMYLALSDCPCCRSRTVKFHTLCSREESREVLESYFDSQVRERKKTDQAVDFVTHLDLEMFRFPQIHAVRLFEKQPLHLVTSGEEQRVHLLIVGGGDVGQAVAFQAMNQAVITDRNPVCIEIADQKITELQDALNRHFAPDYLTRTDRGFRLESSKADGELEILLCNYDIHNPAFFKYLQSVQSGSDPFTYVAVCLPDPDDNLFCSYLFEKVMQSIPNQRAGKRQLDKIPVAFRMPYSERMKMHLEHTDWCCGVRFMGSGDEYIDLSEIIDIREETDVREYNHTYEKASCAMMDAGCKDAEILWNQLKYFRRVSNHALFQHRSVKEMVSVQLAQQNQLDWDQCFREFFDEEKIKNAGCVNYEKDLNTGLQKEIPDYSRWLISKDGKDFRFPVLLTMARMEHRRFCYNLAARGWGSQQASDLEEFPQKIHDCLLPWNELVEKQGDKLIYDLISAPQMLQRKG